MLFLTNGVIQDGFKLVIYFVPFIYLMVNKNKLNLRYYWFFFIGLSLLVFGNILDFADEFFSHEIMMEESPMLVAIQDFCEDFIGSTMGFIFFMLAIYLEYKNRKT